MNESQYLTLRLKTMQMLLVQRYASGASQQRKKLADDGVPEPLLIPLHEAERSLSGIKRKLQREMAATVKGTELARWIEETTGLGIGGVLTVLGSIPRISEFEGPRSVWAYCGLAVHDGKAPSARRGEKAGFHREARSLAIARIAIPIERQSESPYRRVYDERRERTLETHPPMTDGCPVCDVARDEGGDCSNHGGEHWSDGHRRSDALRVTAKAVLGDAWAVSKGLEPKIADFVPGRAA